jgi:hypothetical protein
MSAKASIPGAFLLAWLIVSPVQAQAPVDRIDPTVPRPYALSQPAATPANPESTLDAATDAPLGSGTVTPLQPSSWIMYQRPGCCGPRGGNGPITYELYLRTGPSLVVGPKGLSHTLETGWLIQGGGRSLFFNTPQTAAWIIDLGIGNIWNHGNRPNLSFSIPQSPLPVSTLAMNRTYVSAAAGKEWYLLGPANNCSFNWRIGGDAGGLLGSERLDLRDPATISGFRRRNDVMSGFLAEIYTDVMFPFKSCTLYTGLRAQWMYTFSDIVPMNSDISAVNLLLSAGVRF